MEIEQPHGGGCLGGLLHQTSLARRRPVNCQRDGDRRNCDSSAGCDPRVSHEPPRSTIWLHMNLPLYSPSEPASGGNRGRARRGWRSIPRRRRKSAVARCRRPRRGCRRRDRRSCRHGMLTGRHLPFRLGRQSRAGPAGEGIRLVIADVADRALGIDRPRPPSVNSVSASPSQYSGRRQPSSDHVPSRPTATAPAPVAAVVG